MTKLEGKVVIVSGCRSQPALNGLRGTLRAFNPADGLCIVSFAEHSGRHTYKVHPASLEQATVPAEQHEEQAQVQKSQADTVPNQACHRPAPHPVITTEANPAPLPADLAAVELSELTAVVAAWLDGAGCVDTRCGSDGSTLLMCASKFSNVSLTELLLGRGASPNMQNTAGLTALMYSVNGNPSTMPLLLQAGAHTDMQDVQGLTALMYAALNGNPCMVPLLLQAGARTDIRKVPDPTALMYAVQDSWADPMKHDGLTALQIAVRTADIALLSPAQRQGAAKIAGLLRQHAFDAKKTAAAATKGKREGSVTATEADAALQQQRAMEACELADAVLQRAIESGDLIGLRKALETHAKQASEDIRTQSEKLRRELRDADYVRKEEQRKAERQQKHQQQKEVKRGQNRAVADGAKVSDLAPRQEQTAAIRVQEERAAEVRVEEARAEEARVKEARAAEARTAEERVAAVGAAEVAAAEASRVAEEVRAAQMAHAAQVKDARRARKVAAKKAAEREARESEEATREAAVVKAAERAAAARKAAAREAAAAQEAARAREATRARQAARKAARKAARQAATREAAEVAARELAAREAAELEQALQLSHQVAEQWAASEAASAASACSAASASSAASATSPQPASAAASPPASPVLPVPPASPVPSVPPAPLLRPLALTLTELSDATAGFAPSCKIGQGGFGAVYKAQIPLPPLSSSGADVAVKQLAVGASKEELLVEVEVLSRCAHPHLLPLLGFCIEARCLVYPLACGGSFEDRLFRSTDGLQRLALLGCKSPQPLPWQRRVCILRDTVRALVFLHKEARPAVFHGDVKPANILLDFAGNTLVADVGLAKEGEGMLTQHTHCSIVAPCGTPGFIDPLLINELQQSEITDGYATAITILVALTGQPAVGLRAKCRLMLRFPHSPDRWEAPGAPDATAGQWPPHVVTRLMTVVSGMSSGEFKEDRMPLTEALVELEAIAEAAGEPIPPSLSVVNADMGYEADDVSRLCVICLDNDRQVRFTCGHCVT